MGRRGAEALTRFTFGDERIDPEALIFMNAIMTHFKPRIGSLAIYTDDELKRLTMPVLLLGGAKDPKSRIAIVGVLFWILHWQ